jgi:hypothetical protein
MNFYTPNTARTPVRSKPQGEKMEFRKLSPLVQTSQKRVKFSDNSD